MRRAAVSIPSNIVEGSGRTTRNEFIHFLDIAMGSLRELTYQTSLAKRLGYFRDDDVSLLAARLEETDKVLAALIRSLRRSPSS